MDAIGDITKAAASGIPHLYEWGGLVTLLTLFNILLCFALVALCWVIWQMYKQNQDMFQKTVEATNRGTHALENLTEYVKGTKAG